MWIYIYVYMYTLAASASASASASDFHGRTDGRSDGRTVGWTNGWTDGPTDGRTVRRTDGRTEASLLPPRLQGIAMVLDNVRTPRSIADLSFSVGPTVLKNNAECLLFSWFFRRCGCHFPSRGYPWSFPGPFEYQGGVPRQFPMDFRCPRGGFGSPF
jgi:hypothetical protein